MRKYCNLFFIVFCCFLSFAACSNSAILPDDSQNSNNSHTSENTVISICSLSKDEIKTLVDSCDNLKASDKLFIDLPEESRLCEYITKSSVDYDFTEYYNQFTDLFAYLFPGHELNSDYLFYTGDQSSLEYDENGKRIKGLNLVRDYYDDLASGNQGRVNFLYDETWNQDVTEWNDPVCLELGCPIGYGYAIFYKGDAAYYSGMIDDSIQGIKRYPILESYDPIDYFSVVGMYSPNSTESFQLTDKEVSIKEAVEFFEDYMNNLPVSGNVTLDVTVSEVLVLEIQKDLFGYYFYTSGKYDNVPFDHIRMGSSNPSPTYDDVSFGGYGFMLKSDDVDVVYSLLRRQVIESPSYLSEIISLNDAIQRISKALTSNVVFDVQKIEFVYTQKMAKEKDVPFDYVVYPRKVTPSWKMTLYNANDDLTYICYVNAKDGEGFRYYSTSANMELMP